MKKYIILILVAFLFIGIVFSSGCLAKSEEKAGPAGAFIGGTQGLAMSFLTDVPPSTVPECQEFDIAIRVKNTGEANVEKANIFLGGSVAAASFKARPADSIVDTQDLMDVAGSLEGAQLVSGEELPGGEDVLYWTTAGSPDYPGDQPITITATSCYDYETQVQATACLKSNTFKQATGDPETCKATGEIPFYNSGAPVQVTSITQIPINGGPSVNMNIRLDDVGGGTTYVAGKEDCRGLPLSESNTIILTEAKLLNTEKTGDCEGKTIKLPSGFIKCRFDITEAEVSGIFEDVLVLKFRYGYKQDISKSLTIENLGTCTAGTAAGDTAEKTCKGDATACNLLTKEDCGSNIDSPQYGCYWNEDEVDCLGNPSVTKCSDITEEPKCTQQHVCDWKL